MGRHQRRQAVARRRGPNNRRGILRGRRRWPMPSPFPGMDPYIESWIWGSFHTNLIVAICDQLNPRLPKRYIAATELYVWRFDNSEVERLLLGGPDVHVKDVQPAPP